MRGQSSRSLTLLSTTKMATAWENVDHSLAEMASFLHLTAFREEGATVSVAESTLLRLEAYIHFVESLLDQIRGHEDAGMQVLVLVCEHNNDFYCTVSTNGGSLYMQGGLVLCVLVLYCVYKPIL